MALRRIAALTLKNGFESIRKQNVKSSNFAFIFVAVQVRNMSSVEVTKNLTLFSNEKKGKIVNLQLEQPQDRPLVVMLSWLMARRKHIYKYAELYLKQGFDVLNVSVSPWQLLWPTQGTQVVAKDVLKFLDVNTKYSPLVLHGFSVGGYVWAEVLVHIAAAEKDRYAHIVNRITGQVWDSAADITEISIGLPYAVFPRNSVLQTTLRQYILYHLKTFDKVATRHYIRASQMFYTNLVTVPALLLLSKTDPIGAESSNRRVKECWENAGIPVTWKCWDSSPHVGHFRAHREEYMEELNTFLKNINAASNIKATEKMKAKI